MSEKVRERGSRKKQQLVWLRVGERTAEKVSAAAVHKNHGNRPPQRFQGQHSFNGNSEWTTIFKNQNRRKRTTTDSRPGHRGETRLPWGRGPREPPGLVAGKNGTTLFIDGLPQGISKEWLWDVFAEHGGVNDIFISRKRRPANSNAFGFVRFNKSEDARVAIEKLNGRIIKGKKMAVTIAKYNRAESRGQNPRPQSKAQPVKKHRIITPANRDSRMYVDVVRGSKRGENHVQGKMTENRDVFSVQENVNMSEKLKMAVVLEIKGEKEAYTVAKTIEAAHLPIKFASLLSPNELILFMDEEQNINIALEKESILWQLGKPYRWSDESFGKSRTTWVECEGIHPKWVSYENLVRLGEKWGSVVKVDQDINGVNSLTWARILIKTERWKNINEKIKVVWESGSCVVSVRESCCGCRAAVDGCLQDSEDMEVNKGGEGILNMNMIVGDELNRSGEERTVLDVNRESNMGKENNMGAADSDQTVSVEEDGDIGLASNSMETEVGNGGSCLRDDFSVDELIGGPMSCPVEYRGDNWFDPIASVECPLSLGEGVIVASKGGRVGGKNVTNTPPSKRPRGRPKRVSCSLPDTLSVPPTPLSCSLEANVTWKTATRIGVNANEEGEIIDEIRRSKRVQIREAGHRP
ncbi:unnamed protein product [Amaranthus hypochondriacus]